MKKIEFIIDSDTLKIGFKIENNTFRNIDNTNIISREDLIFDLRYFKNNVKLVAGFLNVMVQNENIKHAIIEQSELIIPGLELLSYIPSIVDLVIKPEVPIDFDMHMAILRNDTLKRINCYSIPSYLLERIDTTKSVKVVTRAEVFFVSKFLKNNKLESYSDVFYKRRIIVDYDFNEEDFKDLEQFLSINTYLRVIYFEYINMDLVKNVIRILRENDKRNVEINIKGTPNNLTYFNELEGYVKKSKYIKRNKIRFKIDYTREYKMENFFKLINFTTLKYIMMVVIVSCVLGYGIKSYDIQMSSNEIDTIRDDLANLLEEFEYLDDGSEEVPDTPPDDTNLAPSKPKPNYVSPYHKNYSKVISVLKNTNPETVGWLTVNNTNVSYPVVQSSNNSYYLNHDFNRNSNSLGWIYMDYRNNPNELNSNTVIYGHNLRNGTMFGSLNSVLKPNWYTNPDNQYITFNTANGEMEWRIFSIYTVATTNDYLYTTFNNSVEFLDFANRMKDRSIYNFGVDLTEDDKIITLSTCQNSGKSRLAIHAVLVKK